jgi:16S rRNA (adenine1518-N6/adenine1519-N6)-dimethyltransferase
MESVLTVPPAAFDPPPRVDSAVVRMVPREAPAELNPALLSVVVREAFSQRRKLLRHSLGRWLQAQGANTPFDLQRRAEEVPVGEYVALTRALEAAGVQADRSDQAAANQ